MIKSITLFPNSIPQEKIETILSTMMTTMKKEKGLLSFMVSEGDLMSPAGPPAYTKVVESSWESLEHFMGWAQKFATRCTIIERFPH